MSDGPVSLPAGIAGELNAVPPTADRTERFVEIVATMNATIRRQADRILTLDSDPRSLEALFARSEDVSR